MAILHDNIDKYITDTMLLSFIDTKRVILTTLDWNNLHTNKFCYRQDKCDICYYLSVCNHYTFSDGSACTVSIMDIPTLTSRLITSTDISGRYRDGSSMTTGLPGSMSDNTDAVIVEEYVVCEHLSLCLLASFAVNEMIPNLVSHNVQYSQLCGDSIVLVEEHHNIISFEDMEFTAPGVASCLLSLITVLQELSTIKYCHGCYDIDSIGLLPTEQDGNHYTVIITYYGDCSFEYNGRRYLSKSAYIDNCLTYEKKADTRIEKRHKYYTRMVTAYDFHMFFLSMLDNPHFCECIRVSKPLTEIQSLVMSQKYSSLLPSVVKILNSILNPHHSSKRR